MAKLLDPKAAGAVTLGDVAAFMIGASAGGLLDATLNILGFAEPLVAAGIFGPGALGVKKALFDVPRDARAGGNKLKRFEVEIEVMEALGQRRRASTARLILDKGRANKLPASEIAFLIETALRPQSRNSGSLTTNGGVQDIDRGAAAGIIHPSTEPPDQDASS